MEPVAATVLDEPTLKPEIVIVVPAADYGWISGGC
jgi:hypothetical protein